MINNLISIIMPIYKVEKELNRCVDSVRNQTYQNIEIILVDDGSPDGCPAMCDKYAEQDERIVVIHKKNGGLSDARNAGLRVAKGDYVLYVDSDDYIASDACERLSKGIHEGVDFVAGAYREIRGKQIEIYRHSNLKEGEIYSARDFAIQSIKCNEWYAPAWLNLYRRQFLVDNNLYYKVGYLFEDHQMLPRLFLAARNVTYVDYPFYNYMIRENSIMTSKNSLKKSQMVIDIYSEWMEIIRDVNDNEYQRYLYGILIRYYLWSCRVRKISGWKISGMDFRFAFKYALNFKEKVKVLLFSIVPCLYIKDY